jgi:hypothetical protein
MLRDQNGQGDKNCQHEEQDWASDAAAPWRKVPRVVGARHLQSRQIKEGICSHTPADRESGRHRIADNPVQALRSEPKMKKTAKLSTTIRANKRKAKRMAKYRRQRARAGGGPRA